MIGVLISAGRHLIRGALVALISLEEDIEIVAELDAQVLRGAGAGVAARSVTQRR